MGGSLLVWSTIAGAIGVIGARRRSELAVPILATVVAFATIALAVVNPLRRTSLPPIDGSGMAPVLEHPAMLIHPPLLYVGMLVGIVGWALALTRPAGWRRAARRVAAVQVGVLAAALALGAVWAYVEQGWGGYWAWDPVENAGLLVWLGALIALHAIRYASERAAVTLASLPWVLVLAGAAIARSGAAPSIHAFAEDAAAAPLLVAIVLASAGAAAWAAMRTPISTEAMRWPRLVIVSTALTAVTLVVVAAGTWWPVLLSRDAMVEGSFYARLLAPVAVAAVVGATFATLSSAAARQAWVAHLGFGVMTVGFVASGFATHTQVWLAPGQEVAGVRLVSVDVTDERAVASLVVAGSELDARIDVFPRGALPHSALHTRPWRDVLVTPRTIEGGDTPRALVDIWRRPLVWAIWLGVVLVVVGTATSLRSRRAPAPEPAPTPRPMSERLG
jgi:cytochrome c biogenesis factor